jgi:hypothetical protein
MLKNIFLGEIFFMEVNHYESFPLVRVSWVGGIKIETF